MRRELSAGDTDAGNLLVQGDNLLALKALLPYYAGKVKCIYIDPPYNTGNEGWIYNDNVNSPEIRQWLRQTVGKEGEDLSRHDKWLCMMYPRLALLRDFLTDDGIILVSVDENEHRYLALLMDELFGAANRVETFIWKKSYGGGAKSKQVEMDEGICRDVTAQRIRKAIEGYGDTPGLGGGFRYCKLGGALFDEAGNIAGEVRFGDLAAHVFFTETGNPLPKRPHPRREGSRQVENLPHV